MTLRAKYRTLLRPSSQLAEQLSTAYALSDVLVCDLHAAGIVILADDKFFSRDL